MAPMDEMTLAAFQEARQALLEACDEMVRRLGEVGVAGDEPAIRVPELRRHGNRLAGALVISREPKPCIRWVRVIDSLFGGDRDPAGHVTTWETIIADTRPEPGSIESVIGAMIHQQAELAARRPPAEVLDWSLPAIHQIRARIEAANAAELEKRCRKGGDQTLRRLRKRLKQVARDPEDEDFHALRKAVRAWLDGMEILAPESDVFGAVPLGKLADQLGDEHDLEFFGAWLTAHGFSPATAPRVWKRLPKLQSRARRKSLGLIRGEVLAAWKAGAV